MKKHILLLVISLGFLLTACKDEIDPNNKLAQLAFPSDCFDSDDKPNNYFISDDWGVDTFGLSMKWFSPSLYVTRPDAEGEDLMIFTARGVEKIKSWVMKDDENNEIFRLENFPPNDFDYAWDGTVNGSLFQDGLVLSTILFDSPTGIENVVEWSFCAIRCDALESYIDDGLDMSLSLWWNTGDAYSGPSEIANGYCD